MNLKKLPFASGSLKPFLCLSRVLWDTLQVFGKGIRGYQPRGMLGEPQPEGMCKELAVVHHAGSGDPGCCGYCHCG